MTPRLIVGTRKGLFVLAPDRSGGTWSIACHAFQGIAVSMALYDPRDGALYAALAHGHFGIKLHRSENMGASWAELAAPAFPEGFPADPGKAAPSVSLVWALEAAGADQPGVLWAGTLPGALFRSDDRGATWRLNESLWNQESRPNWFGGGYDEPGIHSILIDPRDSRRLVLGISSGGVWRSEDGGASWTLGGRGLFAAYMPPQRRDDPTVQDVHRLARSAAAPDRLWTQHHNGVFRSEDGGLTWRQITGVPLSDFGFAVAVHPADPKRAWLVPARSDEVRIPVEGHMIVASTRDGGETFEALDDGLPTPPAYDLVYRHGLDVAPDGSSLAMGSTTGGLWTSRDGGQRWTEFPARLPPIACVRFAA